LSGTVQLLNDRDEVLVAVAQSWKGDLNVGEVVEEPSIEPSNGDDATQVGVCRRDDACAETSCRAVLSVSEDLK
jgi:hypothetical protein